MALSLLLIKLGLEFRGHLIIPVLSLFEVKTDLMDVSESVKIFVLVHRYIWLLVILLKGWLHDDYLPLQFLILLLQRVLLSQLLFDCKNKFPLHLILRG